MASWYDFLCYHSLTSTNQLPEEILSYLPSRFHSHTFDYIAYEHSLEEETVPSIDSSVSAFYSDDSYYFSQILYNFPNLYATPSFLPQQRAPDIQKGRRPRTTDDPKEGPKTLKHPKTAGIGDHLQLLTPFLGRPRGVQPEPLPTDQFCELVLARQKRSELPNQYLSQLSN